MKDGWQLFKKSVTRSDLVPYLDKLKEKGWGTKITKRGKNKAWYMYSLWVYTTPSMCGRLKVLI